MSELISALQGAVRELGASVHLVGGCVRDRLLGRATKDYDAVTSGDPKPLIEAAARAAQASPFLLDPETRTYRASLPTGEHLDLCPMRGTIEEDLRLRDFTVDALAVPLEAVPTAMLEEWGRIGSGSVETSAEQLRALVVDPTGGLADLEARVLRLGYEGAFADDPVRLLRAVRLAANSDLTIEPATEQALRAQCKLLEGAAAERVRDELLLLLLAPGCSAWLERSREWGLLELVLPELVEMVGVEQSLPHQLDVWRHTLDILDNLRMLLDDPRPWAGRWMSEVTQRISAPGGHALPRRAFLMLAALLHDVGKPPTQSRDEEGRIRFFEHGPMGAEMAGLIARRLRLSGRETDRLSRTVRYHLRPLLLSQQEQPTDRALYHFFRDLGESALDALLLSLAETESQAIQRRPGERERQCEFVLRLLDELFLASPVAAPRLLLSGREIISR